MNSTKDNFSFDLSKAVANNESIIKGNNYRITVITEGLIRLEYSNSGSFEDYPTERIWYRNFNKPNFTTEDKDGYLRVTTKYFELLYKKETPFSGGKLNPTKNLKIMLKNTDRVWYYGHPEIRNYNTEAYYNNKASSKIKSLLSLDGFSTIDDSASLIYTPDGSLQKRSNNEIDIYVFLYNKDFYNCLNDYFMVTGSSFLIPRYLLGNIWDKKESYNSNDIVNLICDYKTNIII